MGRLAHLGLEGVWIGLFSVGGPIHSDIRYHDIRYRISDYNVVAELRFATEEMIDWQLHEAKSEGANNDSGETQSKESLQN